MWIREAAASTDPLYFAVIDRAAGRVEGRQTLMRITPAHRSIEIGNIYWGPGIAGTRVATEAMYLFAAWVFESLGYRRYGWKCDALNTPSRRAAERFGFTWEGCFRRAVIVRGRTRDTAWFAMIDEEWPALKAAYERWLAPENFDPRGTAEDPPERPDGRRARALIRSAGSVSLQPRPARVSGAPSRPPMPGGCRLEARSRASREAERFPRRVSGVWVEASVRGDKPSHRSADDLDLRHDGFTPTREHPWWPPP